jgi:hypothetical protein
MLRSFLVGCVALVAGSTLAIGAPQDDVKAAAQKLSDAASYSWKSTIQTGGNNQPGPTEGKTEKDGFTMVTMTRGDNTIVVLRKGDKVAIKTADGAWKTPEELQSENNGGNGGRNPGRFAGQAARVLPAKAAEDLAADATSITSTPDGFAGQLTEDGAKKYLTFGRRGGNNANAPQVSNAKGDVKFMIKDGMLTGYELHVTGTVNRNGTDQDVDRTTTVQISEVGSTKVDAPEDAKKKIEG